jgi:hypothetical protein
LGTLGDPAADSDVVSEAGAHIIPLKDGRKGFEWDDFNILT